jgi:hypothetical protein
LIKEAALILFPFSLQASAFVVFRSLPSRTFFMPLCTGVR